ncbi:MAG TPA: hypothetical protein VEK31_00570, partial [Xanthobacteraceae bacterium]|nr:hypothetical protein [Xanthobacteraceae bacterium]
APSRISRNGQETFGCAFVTGCGSFWVAPEKKLAIFSLNDGLLGAAAGKVAAGEAGAGDPGGDEPGGDAAATGGAVAGTAVDAVVAAPPNPPLQPGVSNANASRVAAGAPSRQPICQISCNFPRVIAIFASPRS